MRGDVEPEHLRRAGGRLDEAEEDLDQRALARTVRADEADHAGLDLEIEIVERDDRSEPLRQRARGDQGHALSLDEGAGSPEADAERSV